MGRWLAFVLLVLSCSGADQLAGHVAREQAVQDFRCGRHDVTVQQMDGLTYQVTGCGSSATYSCRSVYSAGQTTYLCAK
jgi:hypothetical protein